MNDTTQTNNNRMVLLLIAGIPLTMILAATWLWYFVVKGDLDLVGALGTANRGELVQPPRQIDDYAMAEDSGALFRYADLEPKWTLLVVNAGAVCGVSCERSLYMTRQIHIAMGKEFNRIRRAYVSESALADGSLDMAELSDQSPAPDSLAQLLESDHRGTRALQLTAGGFGELFPEQLASADTWYLVDPGGWVMMSYNDQVPYKDVIADLKFLLKNSGG